MINFVETLEPNTPMHLALEIDLCVGVDFGNSWYCSQKEHWLAWLNNYHTVGPYGRKPNKTDGGKQIYNRLNCAPMAFWLAEAAGLPNEALRAAYAAATTSQPNGASQSAAVRRFATWQSIELKTRGHFVGSQGVWI